jgi:mannose-6-phosphate isomerase-like protein (cupin superfamily)
MKQTIVKYAKGFHVLIGDDRSQAASMVIQPGEHEGGHDNSHEGADQWLYVESGRGEATINGHVYSLEAGSLLLIECGDKHEIRSTATTAMQTLNFYLPPAYAPDGDELPAGKGK